MTLERIVRPFQTNDVFNARRLPISQAVSGETPPEIQMTWQGAADGTYTEEAPPGALSIEVTEWRETDRKTEKVRVENPDDKEQFVQVERIKRMTFQNDTTGEQMRMQFNWPST